MSETIKDTQAAILSIAEQIGQLCDQVALLEKHASDSETPINAAKANIEAATVALNAAVEGLNAPKVKAQDAKLAEIQAELEAAIEERKLKFQEVDLALIAIQVKLQNELLDLNTRLHRGELVRNELAEKEDAANVEMSAGIARAIDAVKKINAEYDPKIADLNAAVAGWGTFTNKLSLQLSELADRIDSLKLQAATGAKGINPRGRWDEKQEYARGDLTEFGGTSYISLEDANKNKPRKGEKSWMISASRGGGGGQPDAVLFIAQTLSDAQKEQARTNIGATAGAGTSGTVTSVSVATANGFSGTVATATTTPAITIIAGAITPTSVNGVTISGSSTPTLAVTGTTTVSGANTGDQTTVSGNSGTTTKLATARAINGVDFDGTAPITITAAAGTLTGTTLASNVVTSSLTSVGTIATGVWNGTDIAVADGGTGRSTSTTAYGLIAAGTTATGAHQTLAAGATTEILVGGGASALPAWTTATGSGAPVRATSPTLVTPALGTPSSGVLTSCTVPWAEGFACSDETTALTTGEKVSYRMPYTMTCTSIFACVKTAPTGSSIVIDVENAGSSILSATAQIEVSEFGTNTSATPGVVSGGTQTLTLGDLITIDVDQVGSTIAGAGLKVWLIGYK